MTIENIHKITIPNIEITMNCVTHLTNKRGVKTYTVAINNQTIRFNSTL